MAGTFGYELNPALLSDEEKEEIREQIKNFKKYEMLINEGTYWRLTSPFEDEVAAWMSVLKGKGQGACERGSSVCGGKRGCLLCEA